MRLIIVTACLMLVGCAAASEMTSQPSPSPTPLPTPTPMPAGIPEGTYIGDVTRRLTGTLIASGEETVLRDDLLSLPGTAEFDNQGRLLSSKGSPVEVGETNEIESGDLTILQEILSVSQNSDSFLVSVKWTMTINDVELSGFGQFIYEVVSPNAISFDSSITLLSDMIAGSRISFEFHDSGLLSK